MSGNIPPTTLAAVTQIAESVMDRLVVIARATTSGGMTSPPAPLYVDVPMDIFTPSRPNQIQLLAELGSGRATWMGCTPLGVDVIAGDEVRDGDTVYMVIDTRTYDEQIVIAMSEVRAQ